MTRWAWVLLALVLWPSPARAVTQNCTVTWNARTEADLAGYRVRWGTSSGVYTNTVTLGPVTTTTCVALGITTVGTKYLVVNAFDNLQQHGGASTERSFTLADVTEPSTDPTITGFSPTSGIVGTSVTITGTNFSSTLASNTVKFNNVTASLSAGTTTQLVAVVPSGATTGKISVTVGGVTVQSSGNFTVSTLPSGTVYDSVTDFSGTQGPVWYYLDHLNAEMTFSGSTWNGTQLYQLLTNETAHPGIACGSSKRRWVAPASDTYNFSGITADLDSAGGNGVLVTIVKNSTTTLYSRTIANGDGNLNYAFDEAITAGDTVDFITDCIGTDYTYDHTYFTAHIAGTAGPGDPDEPDEPDEPPVFIIQSLTTTATVFDLNTTTTLTVKITPTPTVNTSVLVASGNQSIVSTPSTITIPANSTFANFTVVGEGAGSTFVSVSLNNSTAQLLLTVLPTATLTAVVLLSPEDQATLAARTKSVILRWQGIHAALRYELRVRDDTISSDNTHPTCVGYRICETNLIVTSYRLLLKPGHSYTWSVKWVDQADNTSDESTRRLAVNLNR